MCVIANQAGHREHTIAEHYSLGRRFRHCHGRRNRIFKLATLICTRISCQTYIVPSKMHTF